MPDSKRFALIVLALSAAICIIACALRSPAVAGAVDKLAPRTVLFSSGASSAGKSGAVWLVALSRNSVEPMYTVPAGRTLFITDVVINRGPFEEGRMDDEITSAILWRQVPAKERGNTYLLNAWVRAGENVVIGLRTPVEVNAGEVLAFQSASATGKGLLCRVSGYVK